MIGKILLLLLTLSVYAFPQVILEADGPGNTYELINSKFAPGYDVVENPECIHPQFGRHIAEVFDADLNQYVFEFYSHVTPDNDRCINLDRQRIEIKTYESSPANLKGVVGETVTYRWKFKIAKGFQPSTSFTHIHQIKAVGGDDGNPIFTLTPRKGSPNKLELIHDNTYKVKVVDLSLFDGTWVECTEVIYIHPVNGKYSIVIKRISDGSEILSYSNNNLMTIRADNTFIRPKWGIYRSLDHPTDLRDEIIRFAGFSIQEGITGIKDYKSSIPNGYNLDQNYPNPFNPETTISYKIETASHVALKVHDVLGREIITLINEFKMPGSYNSKFTIANLSAGVKGSQISCGVYFYTLQAGNFVSTKKMILIK